MAHSTPMTGCSGLRLTEAPKASRYHQKRGRAYILTLADWVSLRCTPGTLKVSTSESGGQLHITITCTISAPTASDTALLDTLRARRLIAAWTDGMRQRCTAGSPTYPLALAYERADDGTLRVSISGHGGVYALVSVL